MPRTRVSLAVLALAVTDVLQPHAAAAQRVVLELRPHFGDTVRIRLDQTSEVTGSRPDRNAAPRQMSTTLTMFSRAIVESSSPAGAMILAITDSVSVNSTDPKALPIVQGMKAQLEGKQMRLKLSPDGTVNIIDPLTKVPKEVTDLVAGMPASFPRGSVALGDTWLREMAIPPSASLGVPLGGVVKAAIRLDSVTADNAYLSLRGNVVQSGTPAASDQGALAGTVSGSMIVDRRRGWLSESRFLVQMRATVALTGTVPMDFRVKISQHMKVVDGR